LAINSAGVVDNLTVADASGHFLANRSGSNAREGYRNAVQTDTRVDGSIAVQNFEIYALGWNNADAGAASGAAYQLAMVSIVVAQFDRHDQLLQSSAHLHDCGRGAVMCQRPKPDPDPHQTNPTPARPGARQGLAEIRIPRFMPSQQVARV
jgi:hypothetical protein